MDKQSIIQYKGAFDSIATYIESDNGQEQVEVWFAPVTCRRCLDMPDGRISLQQSIER